MSLYRRVFALIRHGDYHQQQDAPSAHQPHGLTALGQQQSANACEEINRFCEQQQLALAATHYSSTLRRAWETALALTTNLGIPNPTTVIQSSDQLTERSVGAMANLTAQQIEQFIADDPRFQRPPANWKSDSHYRLPVPGAESLLQAGQRVADFLNYQADQPQLSNELILIVGHGASIRHAAHLLGILTFDDIAKLSMHHAKPVFIEKVAEKQWGKVGGEWKVRGSKPDFTD